MAEMKTTNERVHLIDSSDVLSMQDAVHNSCMSAHVENDQTMPTKIDD